ncbi:chitobiase/beta-hexosaminidase C-terminal domain-containing protein [Candidatus Latescibacterota bacterium]
MVRQYERFGLLGYTYAKSAYNVMYDMTIDPSDFNGTVKMTTDAAGTEIRYTLDGSAPSASSLLYHKPFVIDNSAVINAGSFYGSLLESTITSIEYHRHLATGQKPSLASKYNNGFPGSGDYTLTNCLRGSKDYGDGQWQGFLGNDLEAVIDLGVQQSIVKLSSTYFHNTGVWIFMPKRVMYEVSVDGINYRLLADMVNETPQTTEGPYIKDFTYTGDSVAARFVRMTAKNIGVCPEWHVGAGAGAFMFCDEIVVE